MGVVNGGGGGASAVASVFGRIGAVLAQAGDYSAFYPAIDSVQAPRHTWGAGGTAAGSITVAGSGDWTIARSGTGVYTVTFNIPFVTVPSIGLTVAAANVGTAHGAYLQSSTDDLITGFTVLTETANAAADMEFHFAATGT